MNINEYFNILLRKISISQNLDYAELHRKKMYLTDIQTI